MKKTLEDGDVRVSAGMESVDQVTHTHRHTQPQSPGSSYRWHFISLISYVTRCIINPGFVFCILLLLACERVEDEKVVRSGVRNEAINEEDERIRLNRSHFLHFHFHLLILYSVLYFI